MEKEVFLDQLLAATPSRVHTAILMLVAKIELLEEEVVQIKASAQVKQPLNNKE